MLSRLAQYVSLPGPVTLTHKLNLKPLEDLTRHSPAVYPARWPPLCHRAPPTETEAGMWP